MPLLEFAGEQPQCCLRWRVSRDPVFNRRLLGCFERGRRRQSSGVQRFRMLHSFRRLRPRRQPRQQLGAVFLSRATPCLIGLRRNGHCPLIFGQREQTSAFQHQGCVETSGGIDCRMPQCPAAILECQTEIGRPAVRLRPQHKCDR